MSQELITVNRSLFEQLTRDAAKLVAVRAVLMRWDGAPGDSGFLSALSLAVNEGIGDGVSPEQLRELTHVVIGKETQ